MATVNPIDRAWTSKAPEKIEDVVSFIAREGLPIWRQLRDGFNLFFQGLLDGTITIFGVLIRFGNGVPTSIDPNGSVYVRLDPPSSSTWLYYRFAGAWVLFAGGGGGAVSSVSSGGTGITVAPTTGDVVVSPTTFDATHPGQVPASSGGTAKFLRADGSWIAPPGGSGVAFTQFAKDVGKGTSGHFDLTGLSGLTTGKDVLIVQTAQPIASKGNARDEFEMDNIELTGYVVDAATIRVYWRASGIVVGTYNFAYQVGG